VIEAMSIAAQRVQSRLGRRHEAELVERISVRFRGRGGTPRLKRGIERVGRK
jgi:hypothetical protein